MIFGEKWIECEGPGNLSARSPDLIPLDFWLWGHLKTLMSSAAINDLIGIAAMSRKCLSGDSSKTRNFQFLCDEELKVVFKGMGTTYSICCQDRMNIAHISVGTGFWTYVDWGFFVHLSEY
jgi:hypothetical protein